jgi:hypothetical protein
MKQRKQAFGSESCISKYSINWQCITREISPRHWILCVRPVFLYFDSLKLWCCESQSFRIPGNVVINNRLVMDMRFIARVFNCAQNENTICDSKQHLHTSICIFSFHLHDIADPLNWFDGIFFELMLILLSHHKFRLFSVLKKKSSVTPLEIHTTLTATYCLLFSHKCPKFL